MTTLEIDEADFRDLDKYTDSEDEGEPSTTPAVTAASKPAPAKKEYVHAFVLITWIHALLLRNIWIKFRLSLEYPLMPINRDYHVGFHSAGFRDFLLKPELLRAIVDCGFEVRGQWGRVADREDWPPIQHPSEVQHQCIPPAILGTDLICQAKSGMGKTAVFVVSVLQQLETNPLPVCTHSPLSM